jgi:hypothetical protein
MESESGAETGLLVALIGVFVLLHTPRWAGIVVKQ